MVMDPLSLPRAELERALGNNPRLVRAFEQVAQTTVDTANSVEGLAGASFLLIAADSSAPKARTIAMGAGLAASDGGEGQPYEIRIASTGVTAATYGSASKVAQVTFNARGQATGAVEVNIAIASTAITDSTVVGRAVLTAANQAAARAAIDAQQTLGFTPENIANKAAANGYASLGADGKIPTSQLPALAITDTFVVNSQAAMLALTAQTGDVCVRTDLNKTFILKAEPASTLANWQEMLTPTDAVLSVNGLTGAVTLTTGNIAEGVNLYFTNARARSALSAGTGISYDSATGTISTSRVSASGTYTPALTNVANLDSSTPQVLNYSRNEEMVTVSGRVVVDPTTIGVTCVLLLTPPFASNFSAPGQASGSGGTDSNFSAVIVDGDIASDKIALVWKADTTSAHSIYFICQYRII